jgi:YD repeat-containing protein
MAGAGNDKTSTATGNVAKVNAAERTLTVTLADGSETRFLWTADTKISGTLAPGAKVTIRYTTLSDGQNLAHQISVSRN